MQSAIAICNVALTTYLGAAPITAFEQPSPEAEQCKLHYDRVRRSLLERWNWVFASRREALVQESINDRADVWAYRYARPGHMIAVRWVNDGHAAGRAMRLGQVPDREREMTADSIYSNVPGAVIEYTRDETDPTLFPPAFGDALAATLAAAIAMPITMDSAKVTAAKREAEQLLNEAMVIDFNSRPSQEQTFYPMSLRVRGFT
ncbi:hypothetical protein [Paracoccus shanxieyensis]|uniref:Uncharacterized protein n=1 Tax=Paracoccus shanxieyensis TaxID=2675752 RepID=A0A6L6IXW2_9RHOB|nr:hypothetical protein [Paracoccus shanxieyensis]MTH65073.1 hypothetical protein [Paracoccus shanxieyensis]MTH88217.1 hypothetical protein [Paracoccus shanxieyensis]